MNRYATILADGAAMLGAPAGAVPASIAIVTDAWHPQTNGVVRTLSTTCEVLRGWGHAVSVISPEDYPSFPAPTYPEIRLALTAPGAVGRRLARIAPDAVHIATEGPLGLAARHYCLRRKVPFTTAYHTQFPDYLARRTGLPASTFWPFIRWFHRPAEAIMVATETIRAQLREQGLTHLSLWCRGVDLACFSPDARTSAALLRAAAISACTRFSAAARSAFALSAAASPSAIRLLRSSSDLTIGGQTYLAVNHQSARNTTIWTNSVALMFTTGFL